MKNTEPLCRCGHEQNLHRGRCAIALCECKEFSVSVPTESRQLDAQKVADRLIRKIVHAAFELAETRWDLEISEESNGMGNRVEMADDIVKCLNGEEIGCLDPDDEEDAANIQQFLNECVSEIRAYAAPQSELRLGESREPLPCEHTFVQNYGNTRRVCSQCGRFEELTEHGFKLPSVPAEIERRTEMAPGPMARFQTIWARLKEL